MRAQLVRRIFGMDIGEYGRGVIARTIIKKGVPAWNARKPVWRRCYKKNGCAIGLLPESASPNSKPTRWWQMC